MNKNTNKTPRGGRGIVEYLVVKTELPSDLVGGFRAELRGRNTLFLQGCLRILKYSPEEMILAAKGFCVSVKGERLICSAFHDGTVTVDGLVRALSLEDGGEESE